MDRSTIGSGNFFLPKIVHQDQNKVLESLKAGSIDYADLSQWSFADEFLCFTMQLKFLEFADRTYPNPRKKNEVPIWFLIASQFVLRLHGSRNYDHLKYFLNSGALLTKIGFNTVAHGAVGFNQKNKYERKTAVDPSTVRKFFKDTPAEEIRQWYNDDLQRWFKAHKVYDTKGLFVLDQTHLVVPKNSNYADAAMMPVDEHGQLYKNLNKMTEEQKKGLVYHPCYTLSLLLHINASGDLHHISGYDFGPGNEDELVQARNIVPNFCENNPGVMKELIVDRGYIDGPDIGTLKQKYKVDVLIPLKRNMDDYKDALEIANRKNKWKLTEQKTNEGGKLLKETVTTHVERMDLWEECPVHLDIYVSKTKRWDEKKQKYEQYTWALAATKKYPSEKAAIERYGLRVIIEERNKQLKCSWNISNFPSPSKGLMETHVGFTLLSYSLLQLYLRRKDLKDITHRAIDTLKREERMGKNVVLVYAEDSFAVLDLDDCMLTIIDLEPGPQQKIRAIMQAQKEERLKRNL
jgi:hypothetical protein